MITYGFAEEPIDIIHGDSNQMQDKVASLLVKICQTARITTKKTIAALPSFSVFSSIISLPVMNKKDLAKAIYWQAKKFVPMPLEEMTLDWKLLEGDLKTASLIANNPVLTVNQVNQNPRIDETLENNEIEIKENKKETEKKDLKVLIAAAPKKLVMRYVDIFKRVDLELLSLETENFALERALVGGDKAPVMLVDVGDITSDIIVVENGLPLLSRSVDVGGESITTAIVNSLHVDKKRAEQFKRDIGFSGGTGNLPKIIETVITPIINEIKYCFDLYASRESRARIEKIVLTGGSAFLPQLDQYLARLLNIKVFIGDPWARVIYPVELKPVLDELAPRFSVAVGLAMREIV